MKKFNIVLIAALGILAVACTDSASVNESPQNGAVAGESGTMTSVTFAAASDDITVLAFLRVGNDYKCRQTFHGEWVTDHPESNVYRRQAKLTA